MNTIAFLKLQLKKPVIAGAVLVLLTLVVALIIRSNNAGETAALEQPKRLVEVSTSARLAGQENLSLIGTVRAFTEAQITSERAGRVTSVNTKLGATVGAGQVIATLENSSERASVLQAQGGYEAALAAARQSTIGVSEAQNSIEGAKNNLVTAIKSSYNTTNAVVVNDIDDFFANPSSGIPGLRIDGKGQTQSLNNERIAFQTLLLSWQQRSNIVSTASDLNAEADYAIGNVNRTISFLDSFITLFGEQDSNGRYTAAELQGFRASFTSLRSSLLQTTAALESARTGVANANESINRATLSASGGQASGVDAQVKQALGSLRSAQSNLAKTILRSPISGTVNLLDIKMGDFVGSFEKVAIVANNNALEIVTYVGDLERDQLFVGEEVLIEGEYAGIITTIAPAVDSETKKTEVRIATDNPNISNGDTVRISKTEATSTQVSKSISIPLTAVKFESSNGFIMQAESGLVVQKEVVLGPVRGTTIEIESGLTMEDLFIVDVRGLTPGMAVEIRN